MLVKTIPEYCDRVCNEVEQIHSYKTVCIVKLKGWVNTAYYQWAEKQCTG